MNIPLDDKPSQEVLIARHLILFGTISSFEAIEEYGITRLAAVIRELRKKGWNIKSTDEEGKNRFGKKIIYTRYSWRMSEG